MGIVQRFMQNVGFKVADDGAVSKLDTGVQGSDHPHGWHLYAPVRSLRANFPTCVGKVSEQFECDF